MQTNKLVKEKLNGWTFGFEGEWWSVWGSYGDCSKSCGGGTKRRTRTFNGGSGCPGVSLETTTCNEHSCTGNVPKRDMGSTNEYYTLPKTIFFYPT